MKNDNTTQWVVIGILGFLILNKLSQGANELLSFFGADTGKTDRAVEDEKADTTSPFNPSGFFAKAGNREMKLLTESGYQLAKRNLLSAFSPTGDNEAQAIGVFKAFRTQSVVADFCRRFSREMNSADMLLWLQGGRWPDDRLDNDEIAEIVTYVNRLPKYLP